MIEIVLLLCLLLLQSFNTILFWQKYKKCQKKDNGVIMKPDKTTVTDNDNIGLDKEQIEMVADTIIVDWIVDYLNDLNKKSKLRLDTRLKKDIDKEI